MSSITPGSQYTVVDEDWLSKISIKAYGVIEKWTVIAQANPQINGRGVAIDGSPLIFEGDVLFIPLEIEDLGETDSTLSFAQQQSDDMSVTIAGELVPIVSGSLLVTMDTASDEFTAEIDPQYISESVKRALRPYQYPSLVVRISGEIRLTGAVYVVSPRVNPKRNVVVIKGYSATIDFVDSAINPPYEQVSCSLKQRAVQFTADLGIQTVFEAGATEHFDKMSAKSGENRFTNLLKYARERGVLISCTPLGALLFHTVTQDITAIGNITENDLGGTEYAADFDGRKRFSSYRVTGKSFSGAPVTKTVVDPVVKRPRFFARGSRGEQGGVTKQANWERSKAVADALSIKIPYSSWRSDSGILWRENRFVFVTSESLYLSDGVNLLIRSVRYSYSSRGKTALLNLVPKEVFSEEPIPDMWS